MALSTKRVRKPVSLLAVTALLWAGTVPAASANPTPGEPEFTLIPQAQMSVVRATEPDPTEPGGGRPELALDGQKNTYWHTRWSGANPPKVQDNPHEFVVKLGEENQKLARVVYTPRQSSYGSGRAHQWQLLTSTDENCAAETFTLATEGEWDAQYSDNAFARDRVIDINPSVESRCVQFKILSAWGGINPDDDTYSIADPAGVSSMAEFNAYTGEWPQNGGEGAEDDNNGNGTDPVTPPAAVEESLITLTDGDLSVKMHKGFPQVYSWTKGAASAFGHKDAPINYISINETRHQVTVSEPTVTADTRSATWQVSVDGTNIRFDAVAKVENGTWSLELTNLVDPDMAVNRVLLEDYDLVTFPASDTTASIDLARLSVSRLQSGDSFKRVSAIGRRSDTGHFVVPSSSTIAFGVDSNGVEDNTARYAGSNRGADARWIRAHKDIGGAAHGVVQPGTFVWRGSTATTIGLDDNPTIKVRPTLDANNDSVINWQDGAIAMRAIRPTIIGGEDVKNTVITRIPFNIVSQATHPFLRTLDDTKRIALATDQLGQKVMLKGYEAEGHDSAHPDYAGHYNTRAGGLEDLKILANESEKWNAIIGVHVNATESYSEAHAFSEELLRMPPQKAWGWMNQSYYIDGPKDLGTGAVVERFRQFREEAPENLKWLYIDVYYPSGWEASRLSAELKKQGWMIGSEWADKHPDTNIWSHWANDENYGGQQNKGINSQIFRFVENSRRDVFNPHPVLSNANIVEFEGWTGHVNYNDFIRNVWERNLPTKFLQQSDIMKWDEGSITFANGTVATSPLRTISGHEIPTNRVISYDGATVYTGGKYLLPWTDGGQDRLYHWNPEGTSSTWTLTQAWANQSSLALFKLTDQGRVKVSDLRVSGGQVTIPAQAGVAYVLYPSSDVPTPKAPNWGQGSNINDPGFFSGTLDAYTTTGNVSIEKTQRGNLQALIGEGPASIAQALGGGQLAPGTYNASAWIEIQPGKERAVSLSVEGSGVTATALQPRVAGHPTTTLTSSTALNATASDEKRTILRGDGRHDLSYFQRARVTFTTTGGEVTFKIAAGEGDAAVRIDDLRLVSFTDFTLPSGIDASKIIAFEDFENPDSGYWPFVTGKDNAGGDARTQLAERHEPYSQAGWWGVNARGVPEEGYKLVDNVLSGNWSLLAHEENPGLVLRTTQATVPFVAGHDYKISFDFQNALPDTYRVVTAFDSVREGSMSTRTVESRVLPATTDTNPRPVVARTQKFETTLSVGSCGAYWFGIEKISSPHQADLSIDNIVVEDLGPSPVSPACADMTLQTSGALPNGVATEVSTVLSSAEAQEGSDVHHSLMLPEGWAYTVLEAAPNTVDARGISTQRWLVKSPADAGGTYPVTLNGRYSLAGSAREVTADAQLSVVRQALSNGENYLSDLAFVGTPRNGWGPVERDQANGEQSQGDGPKIRIAGTTYDKGIGAHANSSVSFDLGMKCQTFSAVVGVDDAQTSRGTVRFRVLGDGREVVPWTQTLRANSPAVQLTGSVKGVQVLTLEADQADGNNGNDWASWGDAKVTCAVSTDTSVASIAVDTDTVAVGDSVNVTLNGFTTGRAVSIVNADTGAELASVIPSEGAATVRVTVPEGFSGDHLLLAAVQEGGDGWLLANARLSVKEPEAPGGDDAQSGGDAAPGEGAQSGGDAAPGEGAQSGGDAVPGEGAQSGSGAQAGHTDTPAQPQLTLDKTQVAQGDTLSINVSGMAPHTTLRIELHSDPVLLGETETDTNGKAALTAAIPATVPTGEHTVKAIDTATGNTLEATVTVVAADQPSIIAPKGESGKADQAGATSNGKGTVHNSTGKGVWNLAHTGSTAATLLLTTGALLAAAGIAFAGRRKFSKQ